METKTTNFNKAPKQVANEMPSSDSTLKRYRNDITMNNPYNRKTIRKNSFQKYL